MHFFSVTRVLLGTVFFVAATFSAVASELPQAATVNGKGTIGLVCMDDAGAYHFWNQPAEKAAYDACIDQVVEAWSVKNSTPVHTDANTDTVSYYDLIQGMTSFNQSTARAKAARDVERRAQ